MATLISILLICLISLAGIIALLWHENLVRKILLLLVSFAVGAMFGDAFIHIIPEIFSNVTVANMENNNLLASALLLGGILLFFIIEKFLRWQHCHHLPNDDCHRHNVHPVAIISLVGDGVHNFLDGVLIAASYLVSFPIGMATTLAVLLHEIPQEIGDFATLVHAGFSVKKAALFNFMFACMAFVGGISVLLIGPEIGVIKTILLPLTAGGFIYIAGSDLIPMLHERNTLWTSVLQIIFIIFGISIMLAMSLFE
ncbi:MAG: ZIP family metal transporter [Patescibacteria group bacterium]|nr:ZIP family metal transporter [Patescibacteria group bacterium]